MSISISKDKVVNQTEKQDRVFIKPQLTGKIMRGVTIVKIRIDIVSRMECLPRLKLSNKLRTPILKFNNMSSNRLLEKALANICMIETGLKRGNLALTD